MNTFSELSVPQVSASDLEQILTQKIFGELREGSSAPCDNTLLIAGPGMGVIYSTKKATQSAAIQFGKDFIDLASVENTPVAIQDSVLFLELDGKTLANALSVINQAEPVSNKVYEKVLNENSLLDNHSINDKTVNQLKALGQSPNAVLVIDLKSANREEKNAVMCFAIQRNFAEWSMENTPVYISAKDVSDMPAYLTNHASIFLVEDQMYPRPSLGSSLSERRNPQTNIDTPSSLANPKV